MGRTTAELLAVLDEDLGGPGAESPHLTDILSQIRLDQAASDQGSKAVETTEPMERRFARLPEGKKLAAILDVEEDGDVVPLKKGWKVVGITVKRELLPKLNEVTSLMQGIIFPCDDSFLGDENDETVTLNYVVPHQNNTILLSQFLRDADVPAEVIVNRNNNSLLHTSGGRFVPLATGLYSEKTPTKTSLTQILGTKDIDGKHRSSVNLTAAVHPEDFKIGELNPTTLKNLEAKDPKIPPDSQAVYLAIDLDDFEDSTSLSSPLLYKVIPDIVKPLISSNQYQVVFHNGFLVIFSTAETLGRNLLQTAQDLYQATDRKTKSFVGRAVAKQTDSEKPQFTLNGLPTKQHRAAINAQKTETLAGPNLMGKEFNDEMVSGTTRDTRGCKVGTFESAIPGIYRVKEFKLMIETYKVGGPRHHVGADTDLRDLSDAIKNKDTRVVVSEGPGGIGKSSALDHYIKTGKIANPVKIFIDPGEANMSGAALASAITYLGMDAIKRKTAGELGNLRDEDRKILKAFVALLPMASTEKRNFATQEPEKLVDLALAYMNLLARNPPKISPIFDNFEACDEASLPYLLEIQKELAKYPPERCKTFITRRSERRYASAQVEEAYSEINAAQKGSVARLETKGNNYTNRDQLKKYIIGCLEKPLALELGDNFEEYQEDLGKKYQVADEIVDALAKIEGLTALDLTNIISGISGELELRDNVIIVSPSQKHFDALKKVANRKDLSRFHAGILEDLEQHIPRARDVLTILAITEGKVPVAKLAQALGIEGETIQTTIDQLIQEGYVAAEESGMNGSRFRIAHPPFAQTILEGAKPTQKAKLSKKLYSVVRNDESIDDSCKLALLGNIAPSYGTESKSLAFWQEYNKVAARLFADPEADLYTAALAILDKFDPDSKSPVLKEVRNPTQSEHKTEENHASIESIQNLAANALAALAKSAVIRGRFDEVQEAINHLEKLDIVLPEKLLQEVYLSGFHAARREEQSLGETSTKPGHKNTTDYKAKLDQIMQDRDQFNLVEMRYHYVQAQHNPSNYAKCSDIFRERYLQTMGLEGTPDAENPQVILDNFEQAGLDRETALGMIILTRIRLPLEVTIQELENGIDADMASQPGTLTFEQTQTLLKAQEDAKFLEALVEADPSKVNAFDLITLKEARAQLATLLAHDTYKEDATAPFAEAQSLYQEAASMARRRGLHFETARILHLMGKSMITAASTKIVKWPTPEMEGITDEKKPSAGQLLDALKVLKEALVPLAANVAPNNFNQLFVRSDRVRTAYMLYDKVDSGRLGNDRYRAEVIANIKEVTEQDIKHITDNWSQFKTKPMFCYYLCYTAEIVKIAEMLNRKYDAKISIPECPFASNEAMDLARNYATTLDLKAPTRKSTNNLVAKERLQKDRIINPLLALS